jgi:hypothetical protein
MAPRLGSLLRTSAGNLAIKAGARFAPVRALGPKCSAQTVVGTGSRSEFPGSETTQLADDG